MVDGIVTFLIFMSKFDKRMVLSKDVDRSKTQSTMWIPPKTPKRKTPRFVQEVRTWGVNKAKWEAAIEWCNDRQMEFRF